MDNQKQAEVQKQMREVERGVTAMTKRGQLGLSEADNRFFIANRLRLQRARLSAIIKALEADLEEAAAGEAKPGE